MDFEGQILLYCALLPGIFMLYWCDCSQVCHKTCLGTLAHTHSHTHTTYAHLFN